MIAIPLSIGVIHFVGIGGIGMSGIAEVLHSLGYKVQGSDLGESVNVKRLRALGIPVTLGHAAANLGEAQVVVVSSAVAPDNPEIVVARARLIPVVRRAEMLAELMRLKWSIAVGGTHGKTTTTSLIAAVLDAAGFDPTVVIGGIINAWGSNARLGKGGWLVAEADESDGTFVKLPATVAVVTNIDPEHLDHYKTFAALRAAFDAFVENIPFYGFVALCIDHPEVQAMLPRVADRKIVTYGFSPQADVRAVNVVTEADGCHYDIHISDRKRGRQHTIEDVFLPMLGIHNVENSLAATAVAIEMGIDEAALRRAFSDFKGVNRRFTRVGEADGVVVVDDYGHHPVEIAAVLKAARTATRGQVIAVVQPHRYTRLHNLFESFCTCFNDADAVVVADVYSAGEPPIAGADRAALVEGLRRRGHRQVIGLADPRKLAETVSPLAKSGDLIVCLGARSITAWAQALPGELQRLRAGRGTKK